MKPVRILTFGFLLLCSGTAIFFLSANFHLLKKVLYIGVGDTYHLEERFAWSKKYKHEIDQNSSSLHYCNFPSDRDAAIAGEGKPTNSRWILKQVHIVIRHGDRSPIGNNRLYQRLGIQPNYCQIRPDHQPTHPMLETFVKTMSTDYLRMQMQGHKFLVQSPYPDQPICGSATLSQLGVVQHLHHGEMLRDKYINQHGLLSQAISRRKKLSQRIHVYSTIKSRTIQSAIAFLYGLVPEFHLNQVDIQYWKSDIFNSKPCFASRVNKAIKNIKYATYVKRQQKHPTFQKLSNTFNVGDHSGSLIDGFVTGFLCKNMKLPCRNAKCITVNDLDDLLDEEEFMQRLMTIDSPLVNQSMLSVQPLLYELTRFMSAIIANENAPEIVLISGHDTTLKPLIRTLGIPEYRWPRLGTRLVFELWFDPDVKEHYVRILLNGKDYTSETTACNNEMKGQKNTTMICSVTKFRSYISHGIFKHFGVDSYADACLRSMQSL